ncbi:RDD family protein [Kitasatospora sp. NPDC092948]|uniref:RDD family protein n=1 Tax=Kitasatospora sp. NPDC092948 TaxID=3364088 RepID=UPI003822D927
MSYPPDPNNPYGQQPPQQPGYGYPQQPPAAPGYGYPQAPAPGYGVPQQGYGYPQQGYPGVPPYAGWGSRVLAYIIDYLIVGIPAGILYGIGGAQAAGSISCSTSASGVSHCTSSGSGSGSIFVLLGALVALVGWLILLYRLGTTGQTPGKSAMGIRVARESDGQNIGFGMAIVRFLCHIVDGFCCIGYLWPLWDEKKQTFADKIMSTVVVRTK